MKRLLLTALCLASSGAFAQSAPLVNSDANSSSYLASQNAAGATVDANKQAIEFNSTVPTYTRARVETVAPLSLGGAAAGFSNENCANTGQIAGGTFWFNFGKATPEESIRCNARRDAGVYTALAADARDNGDVDGGWRLRKMAQWKMCTATAADTEACQSLGIIPRDRSMRNAPERDDSVRLPPVDPSPVAIPSRPAGWTNESTIEKSKTPAARDGDPIQR
jgi:hypothetical protein